MSGPAQKKKKQRGKGTTKNEVDEKERAAVSVQKTGTMQAGWGGGVNQEKKTFRGFRGPIVRWRAQNRK